MEHGLAQLAWRQCLQVTYAGADFAPTLTMPAIFSKSSRDFVRIGTLWNTHSVLLSLLVGGRRRNITDCGSTCLWLRLAVISESVKSSSLDSLCHTPLRYSIATSLSVQVQDAFCVHRLRTSLSTQNSLDSLSRQQSSIAIDTDIHLRARRQGPSQRHPLGMAVPRYPPETRAPQTQTTAQRLSPGHQSQPYGPYRGLSTAVASVARRPPAAAASTLSCCAPATAAVPAAAPCLAMAPCRAWAGLALAVEGSYSRWRLRQLLAAECLLWRAHRVRTGLRRVTVRSNLRPQGAGRRC